MTTFSCQFLMQLNSVFWWLKNKYSVNIARMVQGSSSSTPTWYSYFSSSNCVCSKCLQTVTKYLHTLLKPPFCFVLFWSGNVQSASFPLSCCNESSQLNLLRFTSLVRNVPFISCFVTGTKHGSVSKVCFARFLVNNSCQLRSLCERIDLSTLSIEIVSNVGYGMFHTVNSLCYISLCLVVCGMCNTEQLQWWSLKYTYLSNMSCITSNISRLKSFQMCVSLHWVWNKVNSF